MSGVQIGVGLALAAALMTNLGLLLKHRGCQRAEAVSIRSPLRTARRLAGSRWFAAGWAVAAIAWLIHVAALSLAPISIVQAVLAGGTVTLAVMGPRLFGHPGERRPGPALLPRAARPRPARLPGPDLPGRPSRLPPRRS